MTKASVIIPSRAGAERLPVLLDALQAQSEPDFEIIVVLDGDIDGSADVIRQHPLADRVQVIEFPENRGRVAALNAGFSSATGDVLIRCDDDLEPDPDYVSGHLAAHGGGEGGIVGLCTNVLEDNVYARAYGHAADENFRDTAYSIANSEAWRYWAGNCSMTREVWEAVGPYDIRYRAYGWEDVDYGLRIEQAGFPIRIAPELETSHHAAATTTRLRAQRAYRSGQAKRLFDAIHEREGLDAMGERTPWNVAKSTLGRFTTYERAQTWAGLVDRHILPRVPLPIGTKIVALLVETAAMAGYSNNEKASNDF